MSPFLAHAVRSMAACLLLAALPVSASQVVELGAVQPPELAPDVAWKALDGGSALVSLGHPLSPVLVAGDRPAFDAALPGGAVLRFEPVSLGAGVPGDLVELASEPSRLTWQDGRVALLSGPWTGVTERYVLRPGAVKHDVLVSAAALSASGTGDLRVTWRLTLPLGVAAALEPAEGLVLRDAATKRFLARVPPPAVGDAADTHLSRAPARLELASAPRGLDLTVVVDAAWARDPGRVFPLVIDPTLSLQPTANAKTGWVDEFGFRDQGSIDSGCLTDVGFGCDVRGFAEFDTSPIPDGSVVTGVRLHVWLSNHDNPDNPAVPLLMQVKRVATQVNVSNAALHAAIPALGTGVTYYQERVPRTGSSFCPDAFEFRDYDLVAPAVSDLQGQLADDWFTLGFVSQIVDDFEFDHIDYIGYPETVENFDCPTQSLPGTRITLVVTYDPPQPLTCDAGGPYSSDCPRTPIVLDGSGSHGGPGDVLTYAWTTTCNGTIQDASREMATLRLDEPCAAACDVVLTVSNGFEERTCSSPVTAADTTAPVFVAFPPDATRDCDEGPRPPDPTAVDACDPAAPALAYSERTIPAGCPYNYRVERTWTARDACGNAVTRTQVVIVVDTEPAIPTGVPADAPAPCHDVPPPATVDATDNCDPDPTVTFSEARRDGACPDDYTLTRTWLARDACGNGSQRSQVITVTDGAPPSLSGVPADGDARCDAVPPPATGVSAADACDPVPRVTFAEARLDGPCADSYTLRRTWTATDRCGNSTSLSQLVRVSDSSAPALTGLPADASAPCDAVPGPPTVGATDDCDPAPEVGLVEARLDGPCPDSYTLRRTWTATDRCGNRSSATRLVTVSDTVRPVLEGLPANETVPCHAIPAPPLVGASDDCDPLPLVTFAERRGTLTCPDSYTLLRTWTATDRCGNSTSATQTVTVRDDVAPTIPGVPADGSVECDAIPPAPVLTAADNCDPAPVVGFGERREAGSCPDSFTLVRTWTATDRCGNATTSAQRLLVQDRIPAAPVGVPADATVDCDAVPTPPVLLATDNCDPNPVVTFSERRVDGPCPQSYTLTRTWLARDRCGNGAQRSQVLTVVDAAPPVLAGVPADALAACGAIPSPAVVTATDRCDPLPRVSFAERRTDGPCPDTYTLTRTWTGTDACGNAVSASQSVQVRDVVAPVLSGVPADATAECGSVPPPAPVTAADDCDPSPRVSFAERRVDGRCPGEHQLVRTWTATDRCGNSATASQTVQVVDTTPPVVASASGRLACLWPPNHRVLCLPASDLRVEASDACSGPVTWRIEGCASDQPDDGRGDGHTTDDCRVSPDGRSICVRAERQGGEPGGRHYTVLVVAVDACGNESAPTGVGEIYVPHDQSPRERDCERGERRR